MTRPAGHTGILARQERSDCSRGASSVEEAFEARLAALAALHRRCACQASGTEPALTRVRQRSPLQSMGIDKTGWRDPEPRRVRDREHVKSVARKPCLICGRQPADAHHLRFAQSRALGRKVSDEFTVPLCRGHHREVHRYGDEAQWWKNAGVDPTVTARALWLETHPLPTRPDEQRKRDLSGRCRHRSKNAKRGRPISERGPNDKTKPIIACGPQ